MKTTLEEKHKCVHLHLNEGITISEIEQKYSLNRSTLKYCCVLYLRWGEKAFKIDAKRRDYTRQMKLEAIHDILTNGKSYAQKAIESAAKKLNLLINKLDESYPKPAFMAILVANGMAYKRSDNIFVIPINLLKD